MTDSSTYELGKRLTWGSIRADVECRASYASGIIGGTHVPLQEHTAAANVFFPGLPILPRGSGSAGEEEARDFWGEGTGKGRRIAHALGASVQQRELGGGGRKVTMGTLGQQAPHHSGAAREAGGICAWHGKARQGMHGTKAKSSVLWRRGLLSLAACVPSRPQPQSGRMGKRSPTIRSGEGSPDCPSTPYGELDANAGWRSRGGDWTGQLQRRGEPRGQGARDDGRRLTDGRHEALAEGTAHLRTHPHSIVVSIRGNGNGHGHGQAWVHRGYGPWH